jgi:hypothetical protein
VANNFNELTGLRSAASAAQRIANGNFTGQNALATLPLAIPAAARLAPSVGGLFGASRRTAMPPPSPPQPLVVNRLYGGTAFRPVDRTPQTSGLPRYAFRNVFGADEVDDILRSGFMLPPPQKSRPDKYFTLSDDPLGNPANLGVRPVLRVQTRHIPAGSPVSARHVEIWDNAAKRFVPITSYRKR